MRLIVALAIVVNCLGCGENGPKRLPVTGSLKGAEGRKGTLTFLPTGDTKGPSATTSIVDGNYTFTESNGPAVGKYNVIVKLQMVKASAEDAEIIVGPKGQKISTSDISDSKPVYEAEKNTEVTVLDSEPYKLDITLPKD